MKKYNFLVTFSFLLISFTLNAESSKEDLQARVNLILKKDAQIFIRDIVTPLTTDADNIATFYVNRMYLSEGATLFVGQNAIIDAKHVELMPTSKLQTLGHNVVLSTDSFNAVHFDLANGDLTVNERFDRMGVIDTRHREGFHHGSPVIEVGTEDIEPGANATELPSRQGEGYVQLAQTNAKGQKGNNGNQGHDAGTFELHVKVYSGGIFFANGGDGSEGGQGARGAKGGDGLYSTKPPGAFWPENMKHLEFEKFLNGADGSDGGDGGNGGNAGSGGDVIIFCDERLSQAGMTHFVFNKAGGVGSRGLPGQGGKRGKRGSVPTAASFHSHADVKVLHFGVPGEKGNMGYYGVEGAEGADGVQQIVQRKKNEKN